MENNNAITKTCKYRCNLVLCNCESCKTCHFNESKPKEIAQSVNYGAVKCYNSKNGKTYRTEVMRF